MDIDAALREAVMVSSYDIDVIAAVDAKELPAG